MNDFVDECRREWKRLGVADLVAAEMAAELAADLEQADAEGATAEDVLGGAVDPRAFAGAWAAERGVIPRQRRWAARVPAAIAALALVAIVGTVLVIVASSSAEGPRLPPPPLAAEDVVVSPDGLSIWVTRAPGSNYPEGVIFRVDRDDSGGTGRIVGSIMLSVALAAILVLTLLWWVGPERWWRGDKPPAGHAY